MTPDALQRIVHLCHIQVALTAVLIALMIGLALIEFRSLQLRKRFDNNLKMITEIQEQRIQNLERLLGLRPAVQPPQETIQ